MTNPNFKFFYNNRANTLDVVLHGSSQGMDSLFINKVVEASRNIGNSVVALNFPFFDRGEEKSSGPELIEELETLQIVLDECKSETYEHVRLIGKSLGGVIAGMYLSKKNKSDLNKFELIIFGYDIGYIDIKSFPGKIRIVQGSKDKFGDIEAVKKDMVGSVSTNIEYLTIEGADHSYRVPETKEPIFEDQAVSLAFGTIPQ